MKKRILYLIGSLQVGGAERQLTVLLQAINKEEFDISLFVLKLEKSSLYEQIKDAGVEIIDGKSVTAESRSLSYIGLIKAFSKLFIHCLTKRPQVIHGFLPLTNFFAVVCGRLLFINKIIISKRSLSNYQDKSKLWFLIDWLSSQFCHLIIGNSRAVIDDAYAREKVDRSKYIVVYNALISEFQKDKTDIQKKADSLSIVSVANLIPYKGHEDLIRGFKQVVDLYPQSRLVLIGDDRGLKSKLVKLSEELHIKDNIDFKGQIRYVIPELKACDIGVVSSHEEGFSNALLEMLASGLPVVATNVGGNPEAVDGVPDCALVPPHAPEKMGQALIEQIKRIDDTRKRNTLRSEQTLNKYSIQTMTQHYENIYNSKI